MAKMTTGTSRPAGKRTIGSGAKKLSREQGEGYVLMPPEEYTQQLCARTIEEVDRRIMQRENRWRGLFSLALVIAGIFGFVNLTSFSDDLLGDFKEVKDDFTRLEIRMNSQIDALTGEFDELQNREIPERIRAGSEDIRRLITHDLEKQLPEIVKRQEWDFVQTMERLQTEAVFSAVVNRIYFEKGIYRPEEVQYALSLLSELADRQRGYAITDRASVMSSVRRLAEAIHQQFNTDHFDRLTAITRPYLASEPELYVTTYRHYILRAAGEARSGYSQHDRILGELADQAAMQEQIGLNLLHPFIVHYRERYGELQKLVERRNATSGMERQSAEEAISRIVGGNHPANIGFRLASTQAQIRSRANLESLMSDIAAAENTHPTLRDARRFFAEMLGFYDLLSADQVIVLTKSGEAQNSPGAPKGDRISLRGQRDAKQSE